MNNKFRYVLGTIGNRPLVHNITMIGKMTDEGSYLKNTEFRRTEFLKAEEVYLGQVMFTSI